MEVVVYIGDCVRHPFRRPLRQGGRPWRKKKITKEEETETNNPAAFSQIKKKARGGELGKTFSTDGQRRYANLEPMKIQGKGGKK